MTTGAEPDPVPKATARTGHSEHEVPGSDAARAITTASRPILARLRSAGVSVETIADLRDAPVANPRAIAALLAELLSSTPDRRVCELLLDALGGRWARRFSAGVLAAEFKRASRERSPVPAGDVDNYLWTIASNLADAATPEVADAVVGFLADRRLGRAREMLPLALARTKVPHAADTLAPYLADEDICGHVVMALGNLRAVQMTEAIRRLATHKKPWIRTEVMRALAKIEKRHPKGL